ncbi:hypothetical protein APHAL10511_002119 [Amanita phalloides]|nr:hypothetical protein APHAL10511_002119 [Amanita phalloides]
MSVQPISNEFQSNFAFIRTSGPGAALTGLGIECPDFSTIPNATEPVLDTGSRIAIYAPFSLSCLFQPPPSNLSKRNYQSIISLQDHAHFIPHTCCASTSTWSPLFNSTAVPQNGEQRDPSSTESPTTWSLHALSAESGLSPDILATHISTSAEIALQLLSNSQPYFGNTGTNKYDYGRLHREFQPWSLPGLRTPEILPPIVDMSTHESMANQETYFGIDPIDTFFDYPSVPAVPVLPLLDYCRSPDSSFADAEDNDCDGDIPEANFGKDEADNTVIDEGNDSKPGCTKEKVDAAPPLESSPLTELADDSVGEQDICEDHEPSEYEPSLLETPSDQDYVPSGPSYPTPKSRRFVARKITMNDSTFPERISCPFDQNVLETRSIKAVPNVDLGTPVVNAHSGITLTELQDKAERYRLRNNITLSDVDETDVGYDKRWLLSFVGKFSQQGEVIREFRCYVVGCAQTNKRRDHILIHLGGHLGHRPFKCTEWYVPLRACLERNNCIPLVSNMPRIQSGEILAQK